jgi:putative flippase GtrA
MWAAVWARCRAPALFAIAGGLALLLDVAVLYLVKPWLGLYAARVLSFLAAATFTWMFNRHITFDGPRMGSVGSEYLRYLSSMLLGGAVNYAVYAGSVQAFESIAVQPAWGVALGSLAGMVLNFLSARRIMKGR